MKKIILILAAVIAPLLHSCKDWLTIVPETTVVGDNMFNTDEGCMQAITGIYIQMRGTYSPEGSMGATGIAEYAGQSWTPRSTKTDLSSWSYFAQILQFSSETLSEHLNSIFKALFLVVNNINPLLEGMEKYKDDLSPKVYTLVKGEAHALRAYVMFDLWRFWGPTPVHPDLSKKFLPYPKSNTTGLYQYLDQTEFLREMYDDLRTAEDLLGQREPLLETTVEASHALKGDWSKRTSYMNYYALLGLRARIALWFGDNDEALKYARMVRDAENPDGSRKFRLANESDFGKWNQDGTFSESWVDGVFFSEHLMGLNQVWNYQNSTYFKPNPMYTIPVDSANIVTDLYRDNPDDIRYRFQWVLSGTSYRPKKFNGFFPTSNSARNFPLIRLAEIYFIIMECAPLAEANDAYDAFCEARDIKPFVPYSTKTAIEEDIIHHYIAEFILEGVNFFHYKRKCVANMLWARAEHPMDERSYILPLPEKEFGYQQ